MLISTKEARGSDFFFLMIPRDRNKAGSGNGNVVERKKKRELDGGKKKYKESEIKRRQNIETTRFDTVPKEMGV